MNFFIKQQNVKVSSKVQIFNFDRYNLTYGCSFFNTLAKRKIIIE
tara:strand:- start:9774 stop:9908 length:135 start_codon:yes stop_codon:yes gene_type:complete